MTQTLNGKDRRLAFEERLERMVSADVAAVRRGALVNLKLSPEDEERLAQMFTDADESLRAFHEKNSLDADRAEADGTEEGSNQGLPVFPNTEAKLGRGAGDQADDLRMTSPSSEEPATESPAEPTMRITMEAFAKLVQKANTGDGKALANMRKVLDANPQIWATVGDLGAHAELTFIGLISQSNQLMVDSLRRHIAEMKKELAGPKPSLLTRMTVQRVVAAWLACEFTDLMTSSADRAGAQSAFWPKRAELADRRYHRALKSLRLVMQMLPSADGGSTAPAAAGLPRRNGAVQVEKEGAHGGGREPVAEAKSAPGANGSTASMRGGKPLGRNGHSVNRLAGLGDAEDLAAAVEQIRYRSQHRR